MKDKKGFTLVELLAVILILGILLAIAIPGVMVIRDRMTERSFTAKVDLIESAAVLYAEQNSNALKSRMGTCNASNDSCECEADGTCYYVFNVNIEALVKEGLLKSDAGLLDSGETCNVIDPRDSTKCLDCATITIRLNSQNKVASATFNTDTITNEMNCGSVVIPSGDVCSADDPACSTYFAPSYLKVQTNSEYALGNTNLLKSSVESISIEDSNSVPSNAISSWDVSDAQNGSVMAWYTDSNSNGKYELYIGQYGGVVANEDSSYLFQGYLNATSINLTNLDTSNVKNMYWLFKGCETLTSLDLSHFNTSSVTNLTGMFYECKSLTTLDLRSFNTSKVATMYNMFQWCVSLTSINLSSFDTSKVVDFGLMFQDCTSLAALDIAHFDTSNATSMFQMFVDCESLTTLDLTHFDTSKVTNMAGMFSGCKNLTSLDLHSFRTSNVTRMGQMFRFCRKITTLDLTTFDTSKVVGTIEMFSSCSILKTIYVSDKFVMSAVEDSSHMFAGNSVLVGGLGTIYDSNHSDKTYARIDAVGAPGYFTKGVPVEYQRVTLIESYGGQYIDTGIKSQPNVKVVMDMETRRLDGTFFGNHIKNDQFNVLTYEDGRWVIVLSGNEANQYQSSRWPNVYVSNAYAKKDTKYHIEFYGGANYQYLMIDGTKVIEVHSSFTSTDHNNLHIFRRNEADMDNISSMRLYYCKIYVDDTLVRDFVPAYRKSDHKPGLYDLVSDQFFTNASGSPADFLMTWNN